MVAKLRRGYRAVTVRALGCSNCDSRNSCDKLKYYYGRNIRDIPLRKRGVVENINESENEVRLRFSNGFSFDGNNLMTFHPDELKVVKLSDDILGEEKLEAHPLLEMSQQTPLAVIDDRVFQVEEQKGKRTLTEIATLSSLDEMFFSRNQEKIERASQDYATQSLNETGIGNSLIDIPQMIASQVFPYLRDEGYNKRIAQEIGGEQSEQTQPVDGKKLKAKRNSELVKRNLEEQTNKVLAEIQAVRKDITEYSFEEEEKPKEIKRSKKESLLDNIFGALKEEGRGEDYKGSSLLSQAVGERAYILHNGQVQSLVVSPEGVISSDGKSYRLGERRSSDFSQRRYHDLFARKIALDTLDTKLSRKKIQNILEEKLGEIGEFAGMENYEEGDFGFTKHGGSYFVYLKAPEFAIKSPEDGNYYLFDESKIGVAVGNENGRPRAIGIYMIQNNDNPFSSSSGNFCGFCIGGNNLPEDGKDNGEVIAKQLRKIRDIMIFGYYGGGFTPYKKLTTKAYRDSYGDLRDSYYKSSRMRTLDELKARGVLISDGTRGMGERW